MLTPSGKRGLEILLTCGTTLCIFPFNYDPIAHCLHKANRKQWAIFILHKYIVYFITVFTGGRLIQAWSAGHFPVAFKVLNIVFLLAYILTSIAMYQFSTKEGEIRQYFNVLLRHVMKINDTKRVTYWKENLGKGQDSLEVDILPEDDSGNEEKLGDAKEMEALMPVPVKNDEAGADVDATNPKGVKRLSQFLLLGLILLAANPTVHVKLVEESPCTPNFLISTFLPCSGFQPQTYPLLYKLPWMVPEYYFTTVMFSSWSFNWVAIFLGMSWLVNRLRGITKGLLTRSHFNLRAYREAEVAAVMMNDAFVLYLATFPSLLFAIVSVLMLGVIRIWHTDPGSNLMFPLCGVRCIFEAVTPLAVAGEMNTRNRQLKNIWKRLLMQCESGNREGENKETKLGRVELRSLNAVRVTAGSLYTFENSIVLCCLNNCMLLTLNMLVTFK